MTSVAVSSDGCHIVSGSWDHTVRVWDAGSFEWLEVIEGRDDVAGIAGGWEQYPFRAIGRCPETVIEDAASGAELGWSPLAFGTEPMLDGPVLIATHPSGRTWSGVGGDHRYLAIIALEGQPDTGAMR